MSEKQQGSLPLSGLGTVGGLAGVQFGSMRKAYLPGEEVTIHFTLTGQHSVHKDDHLELVKYSQKKRISVHGIKWPVTATFDGNDYNMKLRMPVTANSKKDASYQLLYVTSDNRVAGRSSAFKIRRILELDVVNRADAYQINRKRRNLDVNEPRHSLTTSQPTSRATSPVITATNTKSAPTSSTTSLATSHTTSSSPNPQTSLSVRSSYNAHPPVLDIKASVHSIWQVVESLNEVICQYDYLQQKTLQDCALLQAIYEARDNCLKGQMEADKQLKDLWHHYDDVTSCAASSGFSHIIDKNGTLIKLPSRSNTASVVDLPWTEDHQELRRMQQEAEQTIALLREERASLQANLSQLQADIQAETEEALTARDLVNELHALAVDRKDSLIQKLREDKESAEQESWLEFELRRENLKSLIKKRDKEIERLQEDRQPNPLSYDAMFIDRIKKLEESVKERDTTVFKLSAALFDKIEREQHLPERVGEAKPEEQKRSISNSQDDTEAQRRKETMDVPELQKALKILLESPKCKISCESNISPPSSSCASSSNPEPRSIMSSDSLADTLTKLFQASSSHNSLSTSLIGEVPAKSNPHSIISSDSLAETLTRLFRAPSSHNTPSTLDDVASKSNAHSIMSSDSLADTLTRLFRAPSSHNTPSTLDDVASKSNAHSIMSSDSLADTLTRLFQAPSSHNTSSPSSLSTSNPHSIMSSDSLAETLNRLFQAPSSPNPITPNLVDSNTSLTDVLRWVFSSSNTAIQGQFQPPTPACSLETMSPRSDSKASLQQ